MKESTEAAYTPRLPISVCMIVRNCGPAAAHAINSLDGFLVLPQDEVVVVDTGSNDGTPGEILRRVNSKLSRRIRVVERPDLLDPTMLERMKKYKPEKFRRFGDHPQFDGGVIGDFAAARQVSFDEAKNDLCGWLDADDEFLWKPELRRAVDEFFDRPANQCMFLRYDYAHDGEDGLPTTVLWRERFARRSLMHWAGKCHETLIPRDGTIAMPGMYRDPEVFIRHMVEHRKEHQFSDLRNYAILRGELDESGLDACDPRTIYYLGNACRGLGDTVEAIELYEAFLNRSGSRDDRVLALLHCAGIYQGDGRPWRALNYAERAKQVHPGDPRPYFTAQRCLLQLGRYQQSLIEGRRGLELVPNFHTLNSCDPQQLEAFPHLYAASALDELKDYRQAAVAARRFAEARPGLADARQFAEVAAARAQMNDTATAIKQTVSLAKSIPLKVQILQALDIPRGAEAFGLGSPEKEINTAGRTNLSIYCSDTVEAWGPKGPEGIGGSERMVIEMAKRLQARGVATTVYCKLPPEQRGLHDGVLWRHYLEFNPTIARDVLMAWRNHQALELPVPARQRILWMHDIGNDGIWTPKTKALASRVIFVSPWHREQHPSLPADKAYVSRNGVDVARIEELEKEGIERDPKRIVFASSLDRGVQRALLAWANLANQGRLPEGARLELLYGFTPLYMKLASGQHEYAPIDGVQRHRLDWMEEVLDGCARIPGVALRGRISKDDVLRTFLGAGALYYPAWFDETFCMVAAEAQACGCVPITTARAALQTTNKYGVRIVKEDMENYVGALGDYFEGGYYAERTEMAALAKKDFSLETLADEWVRDLFSDDLGEVAT